MILRSIATLGVLALLSLMPVRALERVAMSGFGRLPQSPQAAPKGTKSGSVIGWPTYGHDAKRSGSTSEELASPLAPLWESAGPPPAPAWPKPAKGSYWQKLTALAPRVVYDRAAVPVAAAGAVVVGSSSDDRVRCFDAKTGALRWVYAAEGPIRFAPIIHRSTVLVVSDDGFLRSLDLLTGRQLFVVSVAGQDTESIVGNGRVIGGFPVRGGPVVFGDLVYAAAGLFPTQGTWVAAFDANTGDLRWRVPAEGRSPQGYLLASDDHLFVPTGRTGPFVLARETGAFVSDPKLPGGAFALLSDEGLVTGPSDQGALAAVGHAGERLASHDGHRLVVSATTSFLLDRDTVTAIDRMARKRAMEALQRAKAEQSARRRRYDEERKRSETGPPTSEARRALMAAGEAVDIAERELREAIAWRRSVPKNRSLILAGSALVVGGDREVLVLDAATGEMRDRVSVAALVGEMAMADGRLFVTTEDGGLYAFGEVTAAHAVAAEHPKRGPSPAVALLPKTPQTLALTQALRDHGAATRGFALVVKPSSLDVIRTVDAFSNGALRQVVVASSEEERQRFAALLEADALASRVAVHCDRNGRGYRRGLFDLVVGNEGVEARYASCAHPDGGLMVSLSPSGAVTIQRPVPQQGVGQWTHAYADAGNTAASSDRDLNPPFAVQWFGGPGPRPMVDRHLRTAPPLAGFGKMIIPGDDRLLAVSIWNGTTLWEEAVPALTRTGFPFDAGYLALDETSIYHAAGSGCAVRSHDDGALRQRVPLPETTEPSEWGWVAVMGDTLLGSTQSKDAARREQSLAAITEQYGVRRPLVMSRAIHVHDKKTGRLLWRRAGQYPNPSLAAAGEAVFAVSIPAKEPAARMACPELMAASPTVLALEVSSGAVRFEVPLTGTGIEHSLFVAATEDHVIITGCGDGKTRNVYRVIVLDAHTGALRFTASHENNRAGSHGDHGEQVHHPVVRGDVLVVEPVAYSLRTGERVDPFGKPSPWVMNPRGGCGTLSGSNDTLFFRDRNPAVLSSGANTTALVSAVTSVSRPGCWISMIPSGGLLLLPEASSGCVCAFSLQTSMVLVPAR